MPTAKVFTGSSNLAPSGEKENGDNLIMIEDQRIAAVYAIEALRIFDHLHFRTKMKAADKNAPKELVLQKPIAISHMEKPWFNEYYVANSQSTMVPMSICPIRNTCSAKRLLTILSLIFGMY